MDRYDYFEIPKKFKLCMTCKKFDGDDLGGNCLIYNMPVKMCGRNKKCKHYLQITHWGPPEEEFF